MDDNHKPADLLWEALEFAEAWLARWAVHVSSCAGNDCCTCGLTAVRAEVQQALADRPNPWRGISAAEYAVVEAARAFKMAKTYQKRRHARDVLLDYADLLVPVDLNEAIPPLPSGGAAERDLIEAARVAQWEFTKGTPAAFHDALVALRMKAINLPAAPTTSDEGDAK